MIEFLQAYGAWILVGLFLVLMLRMHLGGHGGGDQDMGHPGHAAEPTPTSTGGNVEAGRANETSPAKRRSNGC